MGFKPVVFSLLLCIAFVNCETFTKARYIVKIGESVFHKLNYTSDLLNECEAYSNNNDWYNLLSNKTNNNNIEGVDQSKDPMECHIKIVQVSQKNSGSWNLEAKFTEFKEDKNETKRIDQDFQISIRDDDETMSPVRLVTTRNGQIQFGFDGNMFNTISLCNLKLPNGTVYSLYPKSNVTSPRFTASGYSCEFKLKNVSIEDIGRWELDVDQQEFMGNYKRILIPLDVKIEEKVDPYPATNVEIYENQNIHLALAQSVPNFKNCTFVSPKNETFVTNDSCVFIQKDASLQMSGIWKINGTGDILMYSQMKVSVKAKPVEDIPIHIYKDASAELIFGPEESLYCKAKNQNEDIKVENAGQCKLQVEKVSLNHGGEWTVEIGLPESMETVKYKYNVFVEDIGELHDKKIVTHFDLNKELLNVSCKFLVKKMKSCHMTRSDGEVYMVNEGIGFENYKFIIQNNRNNDSDFVECGIEVSNPEWVDLNPWKCTIVSEDDGMQYGSLIMPNKVIDDKIVPQEPIVKVAVGKSFDMICDYPSAINYCWFSSPNQTMYSLISNTNNDRYQYIGEGLQFGQCRMRIKAADNSDDGLWKCNVGIDNLHDNTATIKVDVHSSSIRAGRSLYTWYNDLEVSCKTINDDRIEYCRYVRPDGLGINPTESSDGYTNEGTDLENGKCSMKFTKFAYVNVGIWKCIAKPHIGDEEYVDAFQVYTYSSSVTTYNVLVWSIFTIIVMTLVALLSVMVCRLQILWSLKGRRNTRRSGIEQVMPPPYNADLFMQDEVKTNIA